MYTKVCLKHKKVNESGNWEKSLDFNQYMLYVRRPVLIAKCDDCKKEDNLIETIKALRGQE